MADVKISGLPASTIPLAGTEVLPLVQSGVTKKVASNDLTVKNVRSNATTGILQVAGPAASSTRTMTVPDANFTVARTDAANSFTSDQTLSDGNLVIGTSGKGIDFSATPGTGTSELFNDYEEGTFTPTFVNLTIGNGTVEGNYTKVGRLVTVHIYVKWGSTTSASGGWYINNAPFTAVNDNMQSFGNGLVLDSGTANFSALSRIVANTTDIRPMAQLTVNGYIGWTGVTATVPMTWTTNDETRVNITYVTT